MKLKGFGCTENWRKYLSFAQIPLNFLPVSDSTLKRRHIRRHIHRICNLGLTPGTANPRSTAFIIWYLSICQRFLVEVPSCWSLRGQLGSGKSQEAAAKRIRCSASTQVPGLGWRVDCAGAILAGKLVMLTLEEIKSDISDCQMLTMVLGTLSGLGLVSASVKGETPTHAPFGLCGVQKDPH